MIDPTKFNADHLEIIAYNSGYTYTGDGRMFSSVEFIDKINKIEFVDKIPSEFTRYFYEYCVVIDGVRQLIDVYCNDDHIWRALISISINYNIDTVD